MVAPNKRMDFSGPARPTADKHSTGGVRNKITLLLASPVASFGVTVPQPPDGRPGYTGGILGKFESIAGRWADVSNEQMWELLGEDSGAAVCATGTGLAPVDKKLYALQGIITTVDYVLLTTFSIMSKKITESTGTLILDVKVDSGVSMKDTDRARELASTMVGLGADAGTGTITLLANVDVLLGPTVGSALEVREPVEVLAGDEPDDVVVLTVILVGEMLAAVGKSGVDAKVILGDGRAMDV